MNIGSTRLTVVAIAGVAALAVSGCTSSKSDDPPTTSSATTSSAPTARVIANLTPAAMKIRVAAAIPNARLDTTAVAGGLTQLDYASDTAPIAAAQVQVFVTSDGRVTAVRCADVQAKAATSKAIATCVSLPVPGLDQSAAKAWYRRVGDMATQPAGVPGLTASGLRWSAICAGGRCAIDVAPAG